MSSTTTHTIQVSDSLVKTYPAVDEQWVADQEWGAKAGSLHSVLQAGVRQIAASDGMILGVTYWAWLDDTDYVYQVEVDAKGRYKILGAALAR